MRRGTRRRSGTWGRVLCRGAAVRGRGQRGAPARNPAATAGVVPRAVLPDPGTVLPLSAGAESTAGRAEKRGADVGPVRLLAGGRGGVPDADAGCSARPWVRPRQRQAVVLAAVSLGPVQRACRGGPGAGVPAVLVVPLARRHRPRPADLRSLLPGAVRADRRGAPAG